MRSAAAPPARPGNARPGGPARARSGTRTPPTAPPGRPPTRAQEDVRQHFSVHVNKVSFRSIGKDAVSFSCVDSRSEEPSLGTPGGDIAE